MCVPAPTCLNLPHSPFSPICLPFLQAQIKSKKQGFGPCLRSFCSAPCMRFQTSCIKNSCPAEASNGQTWASTPSAPPLVPPLPFWHICFSCVFEKRNSPKNEKISLRTSAGFFDYCSNSARLNIGFPHFFACL